MATGSPAGRAAPLVFLVAGEPSGDALGAKLIRALNDARPGGVRVAGVGGERAGQDGPGQT